MNHTLTTINHPSDIVIFAASETFAEAARKIIAERHLESHISVTEATG